MVDDVTQVYAVRCDMGYEGISLESVWSTSELAGVECMRLHTKCPYGDYFVEAINLNEVNGGH